MRCFLLLLCALSLLPAQAANKDLLSNLLQPAEQTFLPVDQAFSFDFDQDRKSVV